MPQQDEYELIAGQNPRRPPGGLQGRPPAQPGQGQTPPPSGGYGPGGYGGEYQSGDYGSAGYGGGQGGGYGNDPGGYGYGDPEPPRRNWGWIITLTVVAFVFFAIGAALFTLRDRLGGEPTPTPAFAQNTPGPVGTLVAIGTADAPRLTLAAVTQTPAAALTQAALTTIAQTPVATLTGTPSPTITPAPSPTETPCGVPVAGSFTTLYRREVFGCALTGGQVVWAAWEPFERGSMLWRSDTNRSYWFTLGGQWRTIDASWGGENPPSRGDVPAGRIQPERGFGWVWGTDDAIFQALGWATDVEKGFCAEVQEFEQGFMLQSSAVGSCTGDNLYNHAAAGDWRPTLIAAHGSGVWSGALGGSTVVSAAPTRVMTVEARPEANGLFQALPAPSVQIDGKLDDWAGAWSLIQTPVEGRESYGGAADASGRFQVGWTAQGLQLAVQLYDDALRPGPAGTDLWQGDALELHFDADLAGDFAGTMADGDDFQIGIALNPDGRSLQLYRWLPLAQEGLLPAIGAGQVTGDGSVIELLLPWGYLGLGGVEAGQSFGFNLSISDNDSNAPAQETVVSASPARTTFNNPTEWGTLVLLP